MSKIFLYGMFALAVLIVVLALAGCLDFRPSCQDNPRNMSCMTPGQLEKELNQ